MKATVGESDAGCWFPAVTQTSPKRCSDRALEASRGPGRVAAQQMWGQVEGWVGGWTDGWVGGGMNGLSPSLSLVESRRHPLQVGLSRCRETQVERKSRLMRMEKGTQRSRPSPLAAK